MHIAIIYFSKPAIAFLRPVQSSVEILSKDSPINREMELNVLTPGCLWQVYQPTHSDTV